MRGHQTSGFYADEDRLVLCLPTLRLLSSVTTTRSLVFGLVGSLPSFYPLFALLMVSTSVAVSVQYVCSLARCLVHSLWCTTMRCLEFGCWGVCWNKCPTMR